jgi:enoyl-CoA hydratase
VSGLRVEAEGDAVVLTIDRPRARNAIDRALARRIGEEVRRASGDERVRAVVLTAEGSGTFVSGGDLKELAELVRQGEGPDALTGMMGDLAACEEASVPVVAAVSGDALGGGSELLLLSDVVLLEAHASIAFRQAKMGLSPAWGGALRLVERVGPLEAGRLLYAAEKVSAEQALRLGLVNEVVPTGTSRERALAWVARVAENPRAAVAGIKEALRAARRARRGDSLAEERAIFGRLWGAADHRAAMDAFLKR